MIIRIILVLISLCTNLGIVSATLASTDTNLRSTPIGDSGLGNSVLDDFISPIQSFFFLPNYSDGVMGAFTTIAFQIKNFFIAIAVIFLIIGVIKLLFSSSDEENVTKWKRNIIWTSVGIFVMQIAFSVWNTLIIKTNTTGLTGINGALGWDFWINIFSPVVDLLQMLAAFGFILMAVFSFFIMVTAGGDEEKVKKSKNTILYALVGFLLIKIPYALIKAIYGDYKGCENNTSNTCINVKPTISDSIGIIGKVFTFFNAFLSIICVILIIYAGWLILISGGDEEKIKKAKNIILYIIIGFIVLVGSHAIFNFFILKG